MANYLCKKIKKTIIIFRSKSRLFLFQNAIRIPKARFELFSFPISQPSSEPISISLQDIVHFISIYMNIKLVLKLLLSILRYRRRKSWKPIRRHFESLPTKHIFHFSLPRKRYKKPNKN